MNNESVKRESIRISNLATSRCVLKPVDSPQTTYSCNDRRLHLILERVQGSRLKFVSAHFRAINVLYTLEKVTLRQNIHRVNGCDFETDNGWYKENLLFYDNYPSRFTRYIREVVLWDTIVLFVERLRC